NFDPGFRIELHQKDLNLALEGARTLGLSLPSTALAQQLFSSCAAHGGKAWDHSGMVRALEMMASHEVPKGGRRPGTGRQKPLKRQMEPEHLVPPAVETHRQSFGGHDEVSSCCFFDRRLAAEFGRGFCSIDHRSRCSGWRGCGRTGRWTCRRDGRR